MICTHTCEQFLNLCVGLTLYFAFVWVCLLCLGLVCCMFFVSAEIIFDMRRCAICQCCYRVSVCLSQVNVLPWQLKLGSFKQWQTIAYMFSDTKLRVGPGYPLFCPFLPCPFTSSSFALFYFFPFSFFYALCLFSFLVHPFSFYQNSPTPFQGRRM